MDLKNNKALLAEACIVVVLLCVIFFLLGRVTAPGPGALSGSAVHDGKKPAQESAGEGNDDHGTAESPGIPKGKKITQFTKPLDYDDGAVENVREKETPLDMPVSYEVVMNTEWKFGEGETKSSNAYVENSRANSNPVYLEVILDDFPGEDIYTSKILNVGDVLTDIEINRALPKGDYEGRAVYHVLDSKMKERGTVEMALTLRAGTGS